MSFGKPVADDLSVVIPTVGRPILLESLRRIAAGDVLPKVVVVADQSGGSYPYEQWVEELGVKGLTVDIADDPGTGRSSALNRGLARVTGRFAGITDDDCFAEPTWIAALTARLRAEPDAIVSGRVESVGEEPNVDTATSGAERRATRPSLTFDPLAGGNVGFSLDTYRRVGPFDEHPSLRAAEDGDWAYRALRRGVQIVYAPEVAVAHASWRDEDERRDRYRAYALSQAGFYGKHIRRGDVFIALRAGVNTARAARRWVRGVVGRDPEMRAHGSAFMRYLIPGVLAGLGRSPRDA